MDDKTFTAAFVAEELERLNKRVRHTVMSGEPPSEEAKESLTSDIQETLARLEKTLLEVQRLVGEEMGAEMGDAAVGAPGIEKQRRAN